MPALSEGEGARVEAEHRAWVYSIATQAHARASDAAAAASLAAAEAAELEQQAQQPRLAKLKCDLLRVQAELPPAALVESWDAQAWREVRVPIAYQYWFPWLPQVQQVATTLCPMTHPSVRLPLSLCPATAEGPAARLR